MAAANIDNVILAGNFKVRSILNSLDALKLKKTKYFKLYSNRLEAFVSEESTIGGRPKWVFYPGEGTYIEPLKIPPCSLKVNSPNVKVIMEIDNEQYSKWIEVLKLVLGEKDGCKCTKSDSSHQANHSLEVMPVGQTKIYYGTYGTPLILKFQDGKIHLREKSTEAFIELWEFKHVRKFKCKDDIFFFETGKKSLGGSKQLEFKLREKASREVIQNISQMIHREMKLVEGKTRDSDILTETKRFPIDLENKSNPYLNGAGALPLVKVKLPALNSMTPKKPTIIPSDDLYEECPDDYIDYEDEPEEQKLSAPAVSVTIMENTKLSNLPTSNPPQKAKIIPSNDLYEDSYDYGSFDEHTYENAEEIRKNKLQMSSSLQIKPNLPHPKVNNSNETFKNKLFPMADHRDSNSKKTDGEIGPSRYEGPLDNSLYALPSHQ